MDLRPARAVADLDHGLLLAGVDLGAPPERVFRALASPEVTEWWVRPGVFDTREWAGDVVPGGRWTAHGIGGGRPYGLQGTFVEIDPPSRLVHTWQLVGVPGETTITYRLDAIEAGTRVTLRQERFENPGSCEATAIGWETSFARLADRLAERAEGG